MKGWYGNRQKHSMASKGIRSSGLREYDSMIKRYRYLKQKQLDGTLDYDMADELEVLEVEMEFVNGVRFMGKGSGQHGTMDRSYDEYFFEDDNGNVVEVIQFTEPDWDGIRDVAYDEGMNDDQYADYWKKEEREFYKDGEGEVHVIWAGALDFSGTEKEFAERYPELNRHLGVGLEAGGLIDMVASAMIPYVIGDIMEDDKKKK